MAVTAPDNDVTAGPTQQRKVQGQARGGRQAEENIRAGERWKLKEEKRICEEKASAAEYREALDQRDKNVKLKKQEQWACVGSEALYRRLSTKLTNLEVDLFFYNEQLRLYRWRVEYLKKNGFLPSGIYDYKMHFLITQLFDEILETAEDSSGGIDIPADFWATATNPNFSLAMLQVATNAAAAAKAALAATVNADTAEARASAVADAAAAATTAAAAANAIRAANAATTAAAAAARAAYKVNIQAEAKFFVPCAASYRLRKLHPEPCHCPECSFNLSQMRNHLKVVPTAGPLAELALGDLAAEPLSLNCICTLKNSTSPFFRVYILQWFLKYHIFLLFSFFLIL